MGERPRDIPQRVEKGTHESTFVPAPPLALDALLARMGRDLPPASAAAPPRESTPFDSAIANAASNADLCIEPPLRPWQGALRPLAIGAARAVLFLSRFIIEAQTRFNHNVLAALRVLNETSRRHDANVAAQAERGAGRLIDLERTMWRLRADLDRPAKPDSKRPTPEPDTQPREDLDDLYVALEDRFRGSREAIKERQRAYLPLVESVGVRPDDHLCDLGCGRGEWLELLRERGWNGQGVDGNQRMIERCRALNLDVVHGDAIAFLGGVPEASVAVLSAFHFVEHLAFPLLLTLFKEAARVLRRDGVLLIETPNPSHPGVVTHDFYLDPTHRHPLPAPLLRFLAETNGFQRIEIVPPEANEPGRDYALVARRA